MDRTTLKHALAGQETGEMRPIALVTDNGLCFEAARFASFIESRPEPIHIHTRHKSPQQSGVREHAFGSLKYEHLYRHEIDGGVSLAEHAAYEVLRATGQPPSLNS